MDKNRFRDLLTDLYEKYNKSHLVYLDELVERNHDSPYQAIETIFLKYNHKSMAHYDPVKSTEEYKVGLLKDYEAGKRTFKEVDILREATEQRVKEETQQVATKESEVEKIAETKVIHATDKLMERVNELVAREVDSSIKKVADELRKSSDQGVDYTVTMDSMEEEVILPNKRHIASLGINARLIVKTKSGKPIGLIIKDISYDSFSLNDKVIVSIHLEKG